MLCCGDLLGQIWDLLYKKIDSKLGLHRADDSPWFPYVVLLVFCQPCKLVWHFIVTWGRIKLKTMYINNNHKKVGWALWATVVALWGLHLLYNNCIILTYTKFSSSMFFLWTPSAERIINFRGSMTFCFQNQGLVLKQWQFVFRVEDRCQNRWYFGINSCFWTKSIVAGIRLILNPNSHKSSNLNTILHTPYGVRVYIKDVTTLRRPIICLGSVKFSLGLAVWFRNQRISTSWHVLHMRRSNFEI